MTVPHGAAPTTTGCTVAGSSQHDGRLAIEVFPNWNEGFLHIRVRLDVDVPNRLVSAHPAGRVFGVVGRLGARSQVLLLAPIRSTAAVNQLADDTDMPKAVGGADIVIAHSQ